MVGIGRIRVMAARIKKLSAVTMVGLCLGVTFSAFTANSATVRWSACNHGLSTADGAGKSEKPGKC
jgi:hypothetical protein